MVSLSNHVAIPLMLSTRRQTTIATATRLPRCARNDKPKTPTPPLILSLSKDVAIPTGKAATLAPTFSHRRR